MDEENNWLNKQGFEFQNFNDTIRKRLGSRDQNYTNWIKN